MQKPKHGMLVEGDEDCEDDMGEMTLGKKTAPTVPAPFFQSTGTACENGSNGSANGSTAGSCDIIGLYGTSASELWSIGADGAAASAAASIGAAADAEDAAPNGSPLAAPAPPSNIFFAFFKSLSSEIDVLPLNLWKDSILLTG